VEFMGRADTATLGAVDEERQAALTGEGRLSSHVGYGTHS
jgi:hypothetical protein